MIDQKQREVINMYFDTKQHNEGNDKHEQDEDIDIIKSNGDNIVYYCCKCDGDLQKLTFVELNYDADTPAKCDTCTKSYNENDDILYHCPRCDDFDVCIICTSNDEYRKYCSKMIKINDKVKGRKILLKNSENGNGRRGLLIFQKKWITENQMKQINNYYINNGFDLNSGPKILFGDNDIDNKRNKNIVKRHFNGGQAQVLGKYDKSFAYGIITTYYNASTPSLSVFKSLMDKQFIGLKNHLLNGYDVIITRPTLKDIQTNGRHKYYKNGKKLIYHNIGTGIANLSFDYTLYIQMKIDELNEYSRCAYSRCALTVAIYLPNSVKKATNKIEEKYRLELEQKKLELEKYKLDVAKKQLKYEKVKMEEENKKLRKQSEMAELYAKQKIEDAKYIIKWQWKNDWDKHDEWKSYDNKVSKSIECLKIGELYDYKYKGNGQIFRLIKYSDDTAVQMNLGTMVTKNVRRLKEDKDEILKKIILKAEAEEKEKLAKEKENKKLNVAKKQLKYEKVKMEEENKKLRKQREMAELEAKQKIEDAKYIIKWQWKRSDELEEWISYDDVINKSIEYCEIGESYQYKYDVNGQTYKITKISNDVCVQINVRTKAKRDVRRIKEDKDNIIKETKLKAEKEKKQKLEYEKSMYIITWQWEDENNEWISYPNDTSDAIENLKNNASYSYVCDNLLQYKITKLSEKYAVAIDTTLNRTRQVKVKQIKKHKNEVLKQYKMKAEKEEKQKIQKQMEIMEYENLKKKIGFQVIWQWKDNNNEWKAYDEERNEEIEKLNINQSYEYTFSGNSQNYKITKLSKKKALQINTKTNVKRNVRREQHIYPKWWNQSLIGESQYEASKLHNLISLNLKKSPAKEICTAFYKTVKDKKIISIEGVQNQMLYDKYDNAKQSLIKLIGERKLNELDLFHGARNEDTMDLIQTEGFRKEFNNKAQYGMGTYFARDAKYSINYSAHNNKGIYKIFQCKVLCGESELGQKCIKLTSWPKKSNGVIYDTLVNNKQNPSIFVIHENARAYPMFVIYFK